ncbi:MAG: esterase-like activity of phytase family protein [Gemmatimonadales bacterium]
MPRSLDRIAALLPLVAACAPAPAAPPVPDAGARRVPVPRVAELTTVAGVPVEQGGFGSALAVTGGKWYFLTDRGPNVDLPTEDHKLFAQPGYAPTIGEFRWHDGALEPVRRIALHLPDGRALSGLPTPKGMGASGEVAVGVDGAQLPPDSNGVDTEGLVVLPDGSFWVSEEYRPSLLHAGPDGTVRERIGPFAGPGRHLPTVLAARRSNRGMEGLALVPGTTTLAGLMQGPLDNPKAAGRRSRALRLVMFDTRSGTSRQLVYLLDAPGHRITEIAAVSPTRFLVVEIDGKVPGHATDPARFLRIVQVDLTGATDVSDPADGPRGRLFGGRTLEELDADSLAVAGIVPVRKAPLLDLLDPAIAYPYDKPEGLVVVDARTLALVNDDDFGVDADGRGGIAPKRGGDGRVIGNELWLLHLPAPLEGAR